MTIIWSWTVWYVLFWEWNLDVFGLSQLLFLFVFDFVMFCHVDNFDFTKLVLLDLGVCSQLVYNEPLHGCLLGICCLRGLGLEYPKHFLGFYWPLCANDSQLICKLTGYLNATFSRRLPLDVLVGHVLVGVYPCGRCAIVALLPRIAKLPKKSQNNGFKICEMSWVNILLLFWMRATFGQLEMIWVGVWSNNQHQFNF